MFKSSFVGAVLSIFMLAVAVQAQQPIRDHDITLEDYFTQSNIGSMAISPDGKHILIGTTEGSFGSLQVFPTWHSTQELIDYARQHKVFRQLTQEERVRFGLPLQEE